MPASIWTSIDRQVSDLKRRLINWAKPEDFEIKGRDMRRGEKLFQSMDWRQRTEAILQVAELISEIPCRVFAVQVDKRELPDSIGSEDQMYRLTLYRLLDQIDTDLRGTNEYGMLMIDSRSDLHSSVQDRRIVDAYREWVASQGGQTQFLELPWFGFSAFYAGLQLADFSAYLIDFISNEGNLSRGRSELTEAFSRFRHKVKLVHIP